MSNELQVQATINKVGEKIRTDNGFTFQEFTAIRQLGAFTQEIPFQLHGELIEKFSRLMKKGTDVLITFDIRSKEREGENKSVWFVNLLAYRIESA